MRVTVALCCCPLRSTQPTFAWAPGCSGAMAFVRSVPLAIVVPLNEVMRSPAAMPADAAGVLGSTAAHRRAAPGVARVRRELHAEQRPRAEVHARRRLPGGDLVDDRQRGVDRDGEPGAVARRLLEPAAVRRRPRCPSRSPAPLGLTIGPPESPGWIGALVWIIPCSVSGFWPLSLGGDRLVRPPRRHRPCALGVPPWPPAFPIATMGWPMSSGAGLAGVIVGRPDAPFSWMTATSSVDVVADDVAA